MTERLVYHEGRLLAWLLERCDGQPREDAEVIGVERDGQLVAVVLFDTFSPTGCHVHIAAEGRRWFSRSAAAGIFAFPFVQCGHARVTATVPADNREACRLAAMLGFRREGVMREAGTGGEDFIVYGLLRRECRFLPFPMRQTRVKNGGAAQDVRPSSNDGG